MYCPSCGKPLELNVRFCSACGIDVSAQTTQTYNAVPPPSYTASRTSTLIRPRYPRMIAGVCAAFANQYGWDISLVRVLTVVIALTGGIGGLAYLAAWIIIPEAPYTLPSAGTTTGNPTV